MELCAPREDVRLTDVIADPPVPIESIQPLAVANTFIDRYGQNGGLSHMKLQKLVYYCHGWWLSHYDRPFLNERPEVWKFGPVFGGLYRELNGFGWQSISAPQAPTFYNAPPLVEDQNVGALIDWVWSRYGGYDAIELSEKTHSPGTPWRLIAEQHDFVVPRHTQIPDDLVKQCFRQEVQRVLQTQ